MERPKPYTFKLALITTGISFSGMLCLALADLLPWFVFMALAALHVALLKMFYSKISITTPVVAAIFLVVVVLEYFRVSIQGREEIILALRDIIVFFAVIRLVLPKTTREIYQIIGIGLAECILATIFTQSPAFMIGLVFMVCLSPMALYYLDGIGFGQVEEQPAHGLIHWPGVFFGIIIVSTALFYIIPRPSSTIIKSGLFTHKRTGFSEEVNLAGDGPIEQDRGIALRMVWSQGKAPETFYLAGARLENFLSNGFTRQPSDQKSFKGGTSFTDKLTIYPTGINARNVFFPFSLTAITPGNCSKEGKNYYFNGDIPPVYDVWVSRSPQKDVPCGTYVPHEVMGVAALGKEIAGQGSISQQVKALTQYLRSNYAYSLRGVDTPGDASPVHWFIFDGKAGSCEYYASALAAMIRGCGIPARVVTGFFVHEFNTNGEYFIVRSSDAHAWVEYWEDGWRLADATPRSLTLVQKHSSIFDTLRFRWIRWVIEYSLEDQIRLAGFVLLISPDIESEMGYALYAGTVIVMTATFIWFVWFTVRIRFLPAYVKVIRAFSKKGIALSSSDTHEQHLAQITEKWETIAHDFDLYLGHYLAWRFGGRKINISDLTREILHKIRSTLPPKRS